MAKTKLTWEEVQKYKKVDPEGRVYQNNGQYYFVTEEGGIASQIAVYELPDEDYKLLEEGSRTASDVHLKLRYGSWPAPQEVQDLADKKFIEETPTALIADSSAQKLFTAQELEKLIPIAEKAWIDWKGKLPDDYASPLKD